MKRLWKVTAVLIASLPALGGGATLTTDPLTKLPLIPSTAGAMGLGNEPTRVPASQMCKSKMQTDFYSVNSGKLSATLAWYSAHLPGFRKTHAYRMDRSQNTFYNADGTIAVSITGTPGKDGEDVYTHSVSYTLAQPGLTEKEIIGLTAGNVVCQ